MSAPPHWVLAIHGGAGMMPGSDTPDGERAYRDALGRVLDAGAAVLAAGGSALDAVETAVVRCSRTSRSSTAAAGPCAPPMARIELDAAIMDGRTRAAGGVACVRTVRNPVRLARAVLERSPHVLLAGDGAEAFAREQRVELVGRSYFRTARRPAQRAAGEGQHGTAGAVALDTAGHLAAATSTGGMPNKHAGRVGDSPIIGAGTYADDRTCAVSATGTGEAIMRAVVGARGRGPHAPRRSDPRARRPPA